MDSLLQIIMRLPMWTAFSIPFFLLLLVLYFVLNKLEISRPNKHVVLTIVGTILLTPMPMGMFIAFVPNGYLLIDVLDDFEYYKKVWGWLLISGLITFSILSLILYKILPSDKNKPKQDNHSLKNPYTVVPLFFLGISIISMFVVPQLTRDTSCHNPLRDGGSSIAPKVSIDLAITNEEWPFFVNLFSEFSLAEGLDFQNLSEDKPDSYKGLSISLCDESGFAIQVNELRWAHNNYENQINGVGVNIRIFEMGENTNFKNITNKLVNELEKKWPKKVKFRDSQGYVIQKEETQLN
jgi:hypothetical protein